MNCNLTLALRQMVSAYGWKAVLAELAQLSIDHGKHANADLLLQVSYDCSKQKSKVLTQAINHRVKQL